MKSGDSAFPKAFRTVVKTDLISPESEGSPHRVLSEWKGNGTFKFRLASPSRR